MEELPPSLCLYTHDCLQHPSFCLPDFPQLQHPQSGMTGQERHSSPTAVHCTLELTGFLPPQGCASQPVLTHGHTVLPHLSVLALEQEEVTLCSKTPLGDVAAMPGPSLGPSHHLSRSSSTIAYCPQIQVNRVATNTHENLLPQKGSHRLVFHLQLDKSLPGYIKLLGKHC